MGEDSNSRNGGNGSNSTRNMAVFDLRGYQGGDKGQGGPNNRLGAVWKVNHSNENEQEMHVWGGQGLEKKVF